MGRVFSWPEVADGRLPTMLGFADTAEEIKFRLNACDGVLGGTILGSVVLGECNRRSDLDCFLVYEPRSRNRVVECLRALSVSADQRCVPVEFIPLDLTLAQSQVHHIDLGFAHHLRQSARLGGVIKADPTTFLRLDHLDPTTNFQDYLRSKLRSLEKGLVRLPLMKGWEYFRFLQKVLEVAWHVARKMLFWRQVEPETPGRQGIAQKFTETSPEEEATLFRRLIKLDGDYTCRLTELGINTDAARYTKIIEEIEWAVSYALDFVRLVALRVR